MKINPNELYTPREVGLILKISEVTVKKHIREGDLKAYKAGRMYRIQGKEIGNFIGIPPEELVFPDAEITKEQAKNKLDRAIKKKTSKKRQ